MSILYKKYYKDSKCSIRSNKGRYRWIFHKSWLSQYSSKAYTYGIKTDIEKVRLCLETIDPESVERRKGHKLKRRVHVSQGPNVMWHINRYDKLKPFGFPIHRAIDGFSSKIL